MAHNQGYNSPDISFAFKGTKLEEKNNAPAIQRELRRVQHAA